MEQGGQESIDKSVILELKPLRCLSPVFPSPSNRSSVSNPQESSPFLSVPPSGPFPPGVAPIYPSMRSNESLRTGKPFRNNIASPVPLNSFRTPGSGNGGKGSGKRGRPRKVSIGLVGDSGRFSDSMNQSDQNASGYYVHETDADDASNSGKRKTRSQRLQSGNGRTSSDFDEVGVVNSLLTSFKLMDFDITKKDIGDRELADRILLVYNLLRKSIILHDEPREPIPGVSRRPDLKAGNLLMTKGIRINNTKKIGHVPGIEVGDIFFFRMELCVVGLHAAIMAGIDYMTVNKASAVEDPVALSIVSSGGYEDDGEDGDVLIYSGQGGVQRRDGLMFDQKLERGNLALEKSLQRGNEVRVIRGVKDMHTTGKIYIYDGLYKIQNSWTETNKTGCNVFKYKLERLPGQPEAFALWKSIQQWKDGITSRTGVILPDLTSGSETLPISLVNDVDDEKGPDYFSYIPTPKYTKPYLLPKPSLGCQCLGECQAGDVNCACIQKNMGDLPYNSIGVLMKYECLVHECGKTCGCPATCRNRTTQLGLKVRLEVFKTQNRGWGLRSWDPIRAGGFICEYAGQVIDASNGSESVSENEDGYIFDTTRIYELEGTQESPNESSKAPFPLVINSKHEGNVARFMNHSCSPNVYWQPVLRENDNEAYLHVAFFSIKHIPPMQELTFDYGLLPTDRAEQRRKKCLCGSVKCRGYFY